MSSTDDARVAGIRTLAAGLRAYRIEDDELTIDNDPSGGNYRLAAGSPLIDAGDPAGLAAGESSTDLR